MLWPLLLQATTLPWVWDDQNRRKRDLGLCPGRAVDAYTGNTADFHKHMSLVYFGTAPPLGQKPYNGKKKKHILKGNTASLSPALCNDW